VDYLLKAPRELTEIYQIDCFCLPTDWELSNNNSVFIDLSEIKFIKPLGVIGVLLLVESILKMKPEPHIRIKSPKDSEVLDYLLKINFIEALKTFGSWKIPDGLKANGQRIKPVIPITRFENSWQIEEIANKMQQTFHTEFMGLSTLLQPCHVVFSELANNAVEHAQSNGGFILAQQYDYKSGSIIEISVGDCGIGIPKSLEQSEKSRGKYATDREAILLVLQGGFSSTNDPHRGYGLSNLVEGELNKADRSLTLRSGSGYAIINPGGNCTSSECKIFPGTLAHAIIPCG
jgi:hypothetical protein